MKVQNNILHKLLKLKHNTKSLKVYANGIFYNFIMIEIANVKVDFSLLILNNYKKCGEKLGSLR
jgi:hypothetical protein